MERAINPYDAPAEEREDSPEARPPKRRKKKKRRLIMAEPGTRLRASVLDSLASLGAFLVPFVLASWVIPSDSSGLIRFACGTGGVLILTAYQAYWVATAGVTLGKRVTGIQIVRTNGAPCGFVNGVLLRNVASGLVSMVPYVGAVYGLVDVLSIFATARRCVHDYLADTIVIVQP